MSTITNIKEKARELKTDFSASTGNYGDQTRVLLPQVPHDQR
jgi:hypothetical protein